MFIKITKIIAGSPCESDYSTDGRREISWVWAKEQELLKGYRFLSSIDEGDDLVICKDVADRLPEIASGNFEYEELQPKYMNQTLWSDTNAFEVVRWKNARTAILRELDPVLPDGGYESTNEFKSNESNELFEVTIHKNGMFYEKGSRTCGYQPTEYPHYYRDLSF